MGMLIRGGMLISRLMAFYTLLDQFDTYRAEKQVWDMYEDARSRRD